MQYLAGSRLSPFDINERRPLQLTASYARLLVTPAASSSPAPGAGGRVAEVSRVCASYGDNASGTVPVGSAAVPDTVVECKYDTAAYYGQQGAISAGNGTRGSIMLKFLTHKLRTHSLNEDNVSEKVGLAGR